MLKKRCFQGRVTLIPENKIKFYTIPNSVERLAENIATDLNGFAIPAYQLITY